MDSELAYGVLMTVFGPAWDQLTLQDLEAFLRDAPSEPLEWEGKTDFNIRSVRKQVCGFANSHDGGYLVLGVERQPDDLWALDGATFPNDDPPSDVTDVIVNGGVMPYPDGLQVREFKMTGGKFVAVVHIPPTTTPPCMSGGSVFERVSGKTIPVTDPTRLASLFERGDTARQAGVTHAERISGRVLFDAEGDAANAQFALGLAVPGGPLDLTPRLFTPGFHEAALTRVSAVLTDEPINHPREPRTVASTTQFELVYRVEASDRRLGYDWLVYISREGAVGVHWTMGVQQTTVASLVGRSGPLDRAWRFAHEILSDLGLPAPRYLHLIVGVPFPPPDLPRVARGGVFGPTEEALASVGRELRRAGGEMIFESEPQH
jgi:hypothetical protein